MRIFFLLSLYFFVMLFCGTSYGHKATRPAVYTYAATTGTAVYVFFVNSGKLKVGSDVYLKDTKFCKEKSDYICALTGRFDFAIPTYLKPETQSWHYNGVNYELLNTHPHELQLLGRTYEDVFFVKSSIRYSPHSKPITWIFMYSYKAGLIGFTATREDGTIYEGPYLSTSAAGFGARH